jgi:predicted CXXCH cytochrome family protein
MFTLTIALIPLIASAAAPVNPATSATPATNAAAPAARAKDSCFDCHGVMEGTSAVFKDDVHYKNTLSCADCHGGDPKEDTANASMSPDRGFKVRVTRQGTPDYCGRCHSDATFMAKYNPREKVDQLALYKTSIHARELAAGKKAAECVDCHSVHNIRAASDPLSPTGPQHVSDTCAKCHAAAADLLKKSSHGRRFASERSPGCVACHASHATQPAGISMLTGATSVCARCHNANSGPGRTATQIAQFLTGLEAAGPASKDALDRARLAVHTFNLAAVRRAAEPVAPAPAPAVAPRPAVAPTPAAPPK